MSLVLKLGSIFHLSNSIENDVLPRFLSNLAQLIFMHWTLKNAVKRWVHVLVFALHALHFKCFLPNYARSARNLINRKTCSYIAKATENY